LYLYKSFFVPPFTGVKIFYFNYEFIINISTFKIYYNFLQITAAKKPPEINFFNPSYYVVAICFTKSLATHCINLFLWQKS